MELEDIFEGLNEVFRDVFDDEDIIVGAIDGADEAIIQKFFDDVLAYEINDRNLDNKN